MTLTLHDLEPEMRHDDREQSPPRTAIPKIGRAVLEKGAVYSESEDVYSALEKVRSTVPIPTYETVEQFTVEDLDRVYPEWRKEVEYDDPALVAISYARTQALRKIGKENGEGNYTTSKGGDGLEWAIDHTPPEVGMQFDAHGIVNRHDPVVQLDELLRGGIDSNRLFYSMKFIHRTGTIGADLPTTSGGFIAVGERGHTLQDSGIKYVVAGEEYSAVLDLLRQHYPDVTFIPWDKAPTFFTQQSNEAGETNIPIETLVPSEPPSYKPTLPPESFSDQSKPPSPPRLPIGESEDGHKMSESDMVW